MKIASFAYQCDRFPDWDQLEQKIDFLVEKTAADLVVFPEYSAMEGALVAGPDKGSAIAWRDLAAANASAWVDMHARVAKRNGCHILAGSGPVETKRGVVNRSWLIAPSGKVAHQDKMILTPYERREMEMLPGEDVFVFQTMLGKIGILICYDSEFPLLARRLCAAGADMILVPSCTELPAGQTRVRQSCRARAIENQCLVVQSPLVGAVDGCEIIDESNGRAGFFAPPDIGQPSDGIIAQGETNQHAAVVVEIDPAEIALPRRNGQVGNFAHWPEQIGRVEEVTISTLV